MTKELDKVREALEFIVNREDFAFAECTEAELIWDRAKEALAELDAYEKRLKEGDVSDGYHTFNELYEHRHVLFANVVNQNVGGWKSKLHDDGTMFKGWFIAGIPTKDGDATYHIPLKHWDLFQCREIDKAPKWDGHTSDDVIQRIKVQAAIKAIRGE